MASVMLYSLTPDYMELDITLNKNFTPDNYGSLGIVDGLANNPLTRYIYESVDPGEGYGKTAIVGFYHEGNANSIKTYYVVVYDNATSKWINVGSARVTIPTQASSAPGSFTLTVSPRDTYAELSWTSSLRKYLYYIYLDGSWVGATTSQAWTVNGLSSNTTYEFKVEAANDYGTYERIVSKKTLGPMPSDPTYLSHAIENSNSLRINFTKASDAQYTDVFWNTTGDIPAYNSSYSATTTDASTILITGLPYNSEIYFAIRSRTSAGGVSEWQTWYYAFTTGNPRPANWGWTTSFYSGKDLAVNQYGYYYIMPATEWNSFLARVNEFRTYKGLSAVSFSTYVTNGDFNAALYNDAVNAINSMSAYFVGYSIIPTKLSGSDLLASELLNLQNTLNSIL